MPLGLRLIVPIILGMIMALGQEGWRLSFALLAIAFTIAALCMPHFWRQSARFGWLLGLGYFGLSLRWIIEPFLVDIARHGWMAPFALLFMAGGLALFWGLAFGLARWLARSHASAVLWLAISFTGAEFLRGHMLTGFPWGLISYSLIGTIGDLWLAWVGPYGLTFLITSMTSLTAFCLIKGHTLIWPGLVSVVFATVGLQFLTPPAPDNQASTTIRIVQPNAPQNLKWDPDWMPVFFSRALELTREGEPVDLVIWPETSVPALLNHSDSFRAEMAAAARGAPIIAGITRRQGDEYYNSLFVQDGPGDLADIYDKSHLVPFGEYIPLAGLLRPLGLGVLVDQVAGFSAGTGHGLLEIEALGTTRVLICYEGIFPEEIQKSSQRPDMLLIITNDAWFGNGPGPRQHLVQARARAIEQGLPMIRAANTGISAVIDARGQIIAQLPLGSAGALDIAPPAPLQPTLYAKLGDWPLFVLLLLAIAGGYSHRSRFLIDAS